MRLHHATKARAEKAGIKIRINENRGLFETLDLFHGDAKTLLNGAILSKTLKAEYPAVRVLSAMEAPHDLVVVIDEFDAEGERTKQKKLFQGDEAPSLQIVLDLVQDSGIDPCPPHLEEPEATGSVVPESYKVKYKENGDPDGCNDWLHQIIKTNFPTKPFERSAFDLFLIANSVEMTGKWQSMDETKTGWAGRYRMCGRNKLVNRLLTVGYIRLPNGSEIEVDRQWALEKLKDRPNIEPEWDILNG